MITTEKLHSDFGCHLFKTVEVADLLSSIDYWMKVISYFPDLRQIDGIDIHKTWDEVHNRIRETWLAETRNPICTINKHDTLFLQWVADFTAYFVLHNQTREEDEKHLYKVSRYFESVNEGREPLPNQERWELFKGLTCGG